MDYFVDQIPFNLSEDARKVLKNVLYRTVVVADWACGSRDYRSLLSEHWTLALGSLTFAIGALLTLVHALRHGGRHVYMWLAVFLFGIVQELCMVHLFPSSDVQWHGQSWLTFFGRRTPGYVLFCLYPTLLYTATLSVKRLRLTPGREVLLTAMCYTMLRMPYEMVGTRFLWWTWHSDHPFTRITVYRVPVAMLLVHFWCAVAFHGLYRLQQRLLLQVEYNWKLFVREIACCLLAAFCAPLISYMLVETVFALFEYCCSAGTAGLLVVTHMLCLWQLVGGHFGGQLNKKRAFSLDELNLVVLLLHLCLLTIVAVASPDQVVSTGLHQPFGHCGTRHTKPTMLLSTFDVERFVCTKHVDRYEFDFHCARPQPVASPRNIQEWYTICGKTLPDRGQLFITVAWLTVVFTAVQCYWNCFTTGGCQLFGPRAVGKTKSD